MISQDAEARRLARLGAEMSGVMPFIEQEIDSLSRSLDNRMFAAISQGRMTPETALEGWMERAAYAKLLKHFQTICAMGADPAGQVLKLRK